MRHTPPTASTLSSGRSGRGARAAAGLLLALAAALPAAAAALGAAPASVVRSTPRDTLAGYLAAGQLGDFELAAHYLDLGGIAPGRQREEGARLARRLFLVLLRHGGLDPETVSNAPEGSGGPGAAERVERVAEITARGRQVPVLITRRADAEGGGDWLISRETASSVDALYRSHGYGWIGDHLPSAFFSTSFLGIQLWQWTALGVALVVGYVAARLLAHALLLILAALARRTRTTWDDSLVRALDGPLAVMLWGLALTFTAARAGLPSDAAAASRLAWRLLTVVGLGWLLFRLWDGVVERMRRRAGQANQVTLGYLPIISRTGRFTIWVILLLSALDVLGVNVVAMLAGVGIGGVAIAFAAQKTIENLFGAVTIASDRPFQVGDFVTASGVSGTVELIGLRSTRLRTTDRMVVTIPNGLLAAGTIVNLSARDRFLYNPRIGLRYETTAAQLARVTADLRDELARHPQVFQDSCRVRFAGFGASSLDVEVTAWVLAPDYDDSTRVAEELNFAVARVVEGAGARFAYPSQTLYLGRDAPKGGGAA